MLVVAFTPAALAGGVTKLGWDLKPEFSPKKRQKKKKKVLYLFIYFSTLCACIWRGLQGFSRGRRRGEHAERLLLAQLGLLLPSGLTMTTAPPGPAVRAIPGARGKKNARGGEGRGAACHHSREMLSAARAERRMSRWGLRGRGQLRPDPPNN